ncbi:flavin reductase (NADPH)-like [Mizuhopecten yessoensis]|uniref:flavin reductase (NADPH)-like n=1 Tax=Mizuhopecten yessoensis TaxID=6573 RepID=UPI000B45C4A4|nr:flavin reductase (NADPH)-like [Mizuhopecten yessoensis]
MMRLVVFGATGPTGQYVVKQALARGHYVHALVRSPGNLTTDDTHLTKSRVNIFKPEEIHSHLSGSDALISCLGTRKLALFDRSKVTLYTESLQSIVEAMRMSRTKRLICLSSWGTMRPLSLQRTMGIFPIGKLLDNMLEMEEYLDKHCSHIHYTVVKPAGLLQREASELPLLTSDQERVPGCKMTIARGDVARFVLQCVEQGTWINSRVAIGVRK